MGIFLESINIALNAIRQNGLRAILTLLIIAFGIMALIGMLTAIDSIEKSLTSSFVEIGSNTLQIEASTERVRFGNRRVTEYKPITWPQSRLFKSKYETGSSVGIHFTATSSAEARYRNIKTNPKISVLGVDESYLSNNGLNLESGRNFSSNELKYGSNVCILGNTLKLELFGYYNPIGKRVTVGNRKFRVIGYLKSKGSSLGFTSDDKVLIPLNTARQSYPTQDKSFIITMQVSDVAQLYSAEQEAIGLFRIIRGLKINDPNDFSVLKSDQLASIVTSNLQQIRYATFFIGFVTLLGAAVGLMNIMLVSVKERTKEIGTRMAIGAGKKEIRTQFITEALFISLLGGLVGIILGIAIGNMTARLIGAEFIIPWGWAIFGVIICLLVGLSAGYYPARKASELDPVDALRYE